MYFLYVYFSIFYNDYFQNVNKIIFAYIIDNYIHLGDQNLLFNEYNGDITGSQDGDGVKF